jgi:hypothetical protein
MKKYSLKSMPLSYHACIACISFKASLNKLENAQVEKHLYVVYTLIAGILNFVITVDWSVETL